MPDTRQDLIIAGLCTRCRKSATLGSEYCAKHHAAQKKRSAQSMARLRARRLAAKQCTACGGVPVPDYVWCAACRVRYSRTPAVNQTVNKSERIQERTITGSDGRTRYHGQAQRGKQPHAQINHQDLTSAIRALVQAKAGIDYAESPTVKQLPKTQREDVRGAICYQIGHASRFLDEVLERLGHFRTT